MHALSTTEFLDRSYRNIVFAGGGNPPSASPIGGFERAAAGPVLRTTASGEVRGRLTTTAVPAARCSGIVFAQSEPTLFGTWRSAAAVNRCFAYALASLSA